MLAQVIFRWKNYEKNFNSFFNHIFFSLFSENISAEKSNKIGTNKVTSDEVSDQLKKLLDLYKDGVITVYEYEKEKKKLLK